MLTKLFGHTSTRTALRSGSHVPAAATAAVITITAIADQAHVIHSIQWSYSAAPTGGRLTISVAAVVVFDIDITGAGPGAVSPAIASVANQEIVITLASGAGAVVGKVNAQYTSESSALK